MAVKIKNQEQQINHLNRKTHDQETKIEQMHELLVKLNEKIQRLDGMSSPNTQTNEEIIQVPSRIKRYLLSEKTTTISNQTEYGSCYEARESNPNLGNGLVVIKLQNNNYDLFIVLSFT